MWRNGRRARFRSVCPKGRGGSTPPIPTRRLGAPCPRKARMGSVSSFLLRGSSPRKPRGAVVPWSESVALECVCCNGCLCCAVALSDSVAVRARTSLRPSFGSACGEVDCSCRSGRFLGFLSRLTTIWTRGRWSGTAGPVGGWKRQASWAPARVFLALGRSCGGRRLGWGQRRMGLCSGALFSSWGGVSWRLHGLVWGRASAACLESW